MRIKFMSLFLHFRIRYLKIDGIDKININDFKAVALYSDMALTGQLTTSKLINQFQQNIQWSQRGNFDVPTVLKGFKDWLDRGCSSIF